MPGIEPFVPDDFSWAGSIGNFAAAIDKRIALLSNLIGDDDNRV